LNCRDKITRKRLQSRKLTVKDLISCQEIKNKLESGCNKLEAAASVTTVEGCNKINAIASLSPAGLIKSQNENDLTYLNEKATLASKMSTRSSVTNECECKTITTSEISWMKALNHDETEEDDDNENRNKEDRTKNIIILYDDTTSDLNDLQPDSNPLKIVQENIEQSGYEKDCKILKGKT
jgi:hypothetical protein